MGGVHTGGVSCCHHTAGPSLSARPPQKTLDWLSACQTHPPSYPMCLLNVPLLCLLVLVWVGVGVEPRAIRREYSMIVGKLSRKWKLCAVRQAAVSPPLPALTASILLHKSIQTRALIPSTAQNNTNLIYTGI